MDQAPAPETFATWGIVDLMGHRRLAGQLSEQSIAGGMFLRIDVPQEGEEGALRTSFYGAQAIYSITPTDEATARRVAAHYQAPPIHSYELLSPGPMVRRLPPDEDDLEGAF